MTTATVSLDVREDIQSGRDPFDRMLIAQATVERLTMVTHDTIIKEYKIPIIKA